MTPFRHHVPRRQSAICNRHFAICNSSAPAGATLVEVLMSLLIMSIGVTSVFTLFPLSVLRTIQATNRTNAKIQLISTTESFAANPNVFSMHSPPPTVTPGVNSRFRGQWEVNRGYYVGDIVVPTVKPGGVLPSPNLWFVCVNAIDNMGNMTNYARSGLSEPIWIVNAQVREVNFTWNEQLFWLALPAVYIRPDQVPQFPDPGGVPLYSTRGYVVDPLGWAVSQTEQYVPLAAFEFGNKTNAMTGIGTTLPVTATDRLHLLRINSGYNTELAAEAGVSLLDTWEEVVRATPSAATTTSVTFPPTVPLGNIGGFRRVVLTSTDGSVTVTRDIFNVAGQVVNWVPQNPLPIRFPGVSSGTPDIGSARIETFDRRYTWFATVKKDRDGNTTTKFVVVFKRAFTPADEHVYDANFSNPTIDLDMSGAADGVEHALPLTSRDWVMIVWNAATEPDPLLKPGNFLFDARDVEWYRIREIIDHDVVGGTTHHAMIRLDRAVNTITRDDGSGPPSQPLLVGRVILMRGIVDIFDL